jgi:hypothetical protein
MSRRRALPLGHLRRRGQRALRRRADTLIEDPDPEGIVIKLISLSNSREQARILPVLLIL